MCLQWRRLLWCLHLPVCMCGVDLILKGIDGTWDNLVPPEEAPQCVSLGMFVWLSLTSAEAP